MPLKWYTKSFILVAAILFSVVLFYQIGQYNQNDLMGSFKYAYNQGLTDIKKDVTNQVIFPRDFPLQKEELKAYVKQNFNLTDFDNSRLFKNEVSKPDIPSSKFSKHNLTVFNSDTNIKLNLKKCAAKLQTTSVIEIDKAKNIGVSLPEILTNFLKECETNPYYKELAPFFIDELKLQLKYNVVEKYWYRLAGSSVWLEQYGVHFMISRILYSPKGARNQPIISLTYAQIFSKDWKELTNTKLVVPTNYIDGMEDTEVIDDQRFEALKFPYFLPIPFWHDYDNVEHKYYGPDDPRILLVKNTKGYLEPLIIFNAYHRKLSRYDDDEDDGLVLKQDFYRSMFMSWPWQFQKGKPNTDGMGNKEFDDKLYNKAIELKIKNIPRQKKQKNWTPFISDNLRTIHRYDKFVNFVYRWANFEVLKCDLINDSGSCSFTYRLNHLISTESQVGPLRGGTELKNINDLIRTQTDLPLEKLLPLHREIWVGFARAHLDKCGCGNNMYRPNMVVVVKDSISTKKNVNDPKSPKVIKDFYKISHISSSISLDIPIIGWDLENPKDVCIGSNILIPNGISSWNIKSIKENSKTGFFEADDYMTLSLSISDFTVHTINIKGLLNQILNFNDKSLFMPIDSDSEDESFSTNIKNLHIPDPRIVDNPRKNNLLWLTGYNNDNVLCALDSSAKFCAAYGMANEKNFQDDSEDYDYDLNDDFVDPNVSKYEQELYLYKLNEELKKRPNRVNSRPPSRQMSPDRNSDRKSNASPDDNDDTDEGNTKKFKQGISNPNEKSSKSDKK